MIIIIRYLQGAKIERKYSEIKLGNGYVYNGQPEDPTVENKKEVVSQVCYVKPYGLKMLHYAAIAFSAYYDMNVYNDEINQTGFNGKDFKTREGKFLNEFFEDPKYKFSSVKSMELEQNELGAANIFHFDQFNLTVIGIRGTFDKMDVSIDIQAFLSSLFLTASSLGALATDSIPVTARAIRSILAYPLTLLSGKALLDSYKDSIDQFIKENQPEFRTNVIFTGHSLGGGMAKLFGHIYGYASVSISGPGVTLLQTLYDSPKKDLNMVITQAEIIPDRDFIPRVEVSAGTKYRVLCNQAKLGCHGKAHTLCMMGLMCQTPHDSFCENLDDTSEIYDGMKKLASEYEII